jgi:hypothetical protein
MGNESLPAAGQLVSQAVKDTFSDLLDKLLVDLGREIILVLKPTQSDCPNCGFLLTTGKSNSIYNTSNPNVAGPLNRPFANGQVCPVCNGQGRLKVPRTTNYTATISKKFKARELVEAGIARVDNTVVKTNTVITSLQDIIECTSAIIDGKNYIKLGDPIKTGLQELIRVKMYWKLAD